MTVLTDADLLDARLRRALHPLDSPLPMRGRNYDELADVLDPAVALVDAAVLVGLVHRDTGLQVLLTRRTDALRLMEHVLPDRERAKA